MPNVKCLRAGKYADPDSAATPQLRLKVDDVVEIHDAWADRLISKGDAELVDVSDEEEESEEDDDSDSKPNGNSKPPWER